MIGLGLSIFNGSADSPLSVAGIASTYSALHAWSAEDITINGTTTTLNDFGSVGGYELANVTAGEQPIYNASDSDLGGKASVEQGLSSVYRLQKTGINFRNADTTGVITTVIYHDAVGYGRIFCYKTTASPGHSNNHLIDPNSNIIISYDAALKETETENRNTAAAWVVSMYNNGTINKIMVNGVVKATTGGSGEWFSDWGDTNYVGILAHPTSASGGAYQQGYLDYTAYTNETAITNQHTDLMSFYGV